MEMNRAALVTCDFGSPPRRAAGSHPRLSRIGFPRPTGAPRAMEATVGLLNSPRVPEARARPMTLPLPEILLAPYHLVHAGEFISRRHLLCIKPSARFRPFCVLSFPSRPSPSPSP
ncbi:uncharacterized protein [Triticum aestivum]|uniref:uncharacterized protein n=1 Tax=Triticum aestivum TaxID=4565 RepID=UPI001D027944|nr:uncharacterized protein LOC123115873 [Triticum aestivum]